MATPFTFFRKYTGWMMAVLCVMLMFAFVVGDPIMNRLQGEGGPGTGSRKTAVTWKGGSLTEGDLSTLIAKRASLMRFMGGIEYTGRSAAEREGAGGLPPRVRFMPLPTSRDQGVEADVVRMKVVADAARKAGMVIGDGAVLDYLAGLGRDRVTPQEISDIAKQVGRDAGPLASLNNLLEGVREMLLVRSFLGSLTFEQITVTPQQRYAFWEKLNDRMAVEAAPIAAESLVAKVADPTDAELRKYFDAHKDFDPQPVRVMGVELPSPDPGFAVPRRFELQYLQASYDDFVAKAAEEVTDEQIAQYYEANKEQFVKTSTDLFGEDDAADGPATDSPEMGDGAGSETPEEPAEDAKEDGEKAAEADKPATDEPASEEADSEGPGSDEPAGDDAPEQESPTSDAADEESPAESMESDGDTDAETPAESESEADEAAEAEPEATPEKPSEPAESPQPEGEPQSARPSRSPFRLAAYQPEETAADDPAPDAQDAPAADEEPAAEGEDGEDQPAADKTEADKPEADLFDGLTDGMETEPSQDAKPADETAAPEKPKQYEPLEDVREEIRQMLARDQAPVKMMEVIEPIQAKLKATYNDYFSKVLDAEDAGQTVPEPPAELLDLTQVAKEAGLTFEKVEPVTVLELFDKPVGKALDLNAGDDTPLAARMAAKRGMYLYDPMVAIGNTMSGSDIYIVMKLAETERKVPELDEVRDRVVQEWKLSKAADLALAEAKKLAGDASPSGVPLVEFFANEPEIKVETSEPFTWLELGYVDPMSGNAVVRLSQPKPLEGVGPDFMEAVAGLEVGETTAALNHDRSIAYVVRMSEKLESEDSLRSAFLKDARMYAGLPNLIRQQMGEVSGAVLDSFDIDWKRDPDALAPSEE
ncbi:hypothetical protein Pla175_42830 [Pirellulimonas nuda]|uniref:Periplasmic folding chaperone n=1 Tax=Pirellulimonas nuda TaxID=2528009 RepID=A0A518DHB7_9BACT|nr:hypothetical protein [Pirellulimonas nuda]QDU90870.1 hypothetical protein Pla175_42830 [Pirellulimonas nuda]